MRTIAVMLAVLAIIVGTYALTDLAPSRLEYDIGERIRRTLEKPTDESQFVVELERELRQERNSRLVEFLTGIFWCAFLSFLALQAARHALRRECPSVDFEPRSFQPFRCDLVHHIRRFSAAFLTRGDRVAQARSSLRPTLERLFGSKEG